MTVYALIESGIVTNTIVWDGNTETWSPPEGVIAVLIPPDKPVSIGWSYDGTNFIAPIPTTAEILAQNQRLQQSLMAEASQTMTPLFMSLQLGDATDAETLRAKAWQAYYRDLQVIDVSVPSPAWPTVPA